MYWKGSKSLEWDADLVQPQDYFKFDELADAAWKYGNELLLIDLVDNEAGLLHAFSETGIKSFESLSPEYCLEQGMKVGIIAHSCVAVLAKSMKNNLGDQETYQPQEGDTFVKVGAIKHVGIEHVEYRVNTVPGFSGGPVFLLRHGETEDTKITAVHAGYSEDRQTNFGFLVAREVADKSTCVAL